MRTEKMDAGLVRRCGRCGRPAFVDSFVDTAGRDTKFCRPCRYERTGASEPNKFGREYDAVAIINNNGYNERTRQVRVRTDWYRQKKK